jgi:hypothetical protein
MNQAVIRGILAGGLLAATAFAQKRIPTSFTRPVELDAECIQFKAFAGAEATTVPPPRVFHATRTKDGSPVELFDPVQLWRAPQMLGYWQVPGGPSLRLAVVTTGPLELSTEKEDARVILERPECDALIAKAPQVDLADSASLSAWLAFYGSGKLKGPIQNLPDTIVLQRVRAARVESKSETRIVLLFSVKPGMHGANPDRVYAAWIELADKSAPDEAVQAMVRGFLPTIKPSGRPQAFAAKPAAKPGASKAEESPERVRSRETVLQTIRGLPKWWSLETERYILVSDLAGSERAFVKRLSDDLSRLCAMYEKLIPPRKKIEAVSAVRVFANGEDYVQYVGGGYAWTAGQWNPSRLELIIRSSNWMQGKAKKENIGEIVRHEALHQYFFYAFPGNSMSIWFNEGHATFLEGVELLPNGVRLGEVEHYARQVEGMVQAGPVPLQALLKMSPADFYNGGGSDRGRSQNYALAWSLVYFLRKGAPSDPEPKFAAILPKYEAALREGKSGQEANDLAFEGIYPEALESAWREFWNSDSRRVAAKRLDLFAAAP